MIKRLLKKIIKKIPIGNYVMFESVPDLSDNTKSVFDEMLRRGINNKYRCVWWVSDKKRELPRYKNTKYVDTNNAWNRIQYHYYRLRAKCLICCNLFLVSSNSNQKSFYLTHGTAIKKLGEYILPSNISFVIIASDGTKKHMVNELKGDVNRFFALGFPRNDILQKTNVDLHKMFGIRYDKIIAWYPTFRQHKSGLQTESKCALPLLHDIHKAIALNEIAKDNKILIAVKPHFAQDVSYITKYNLSNIIFIDDDFFCNHNISSYEFIGSCDALITDYSSIYFDYLLCDKPVAVAWEDIDEYKKNPGFAIDVDYYMKAAEKLYILDDFVQFVIDVAKGNDKWKKERAEISSWANYSSDGNNTDRVVSFIVEEADLN